MVFKCATEIVHIVSGILETYAVKCSLILAQPLCVCVCVYLYLTHTLYMQM